MTFSVLLCAHVSMAAGLFGDDDEEAVVDDSKTSKKLQSLKRKPGPKPVVAIYDFRSMVPDVPTASALDMFVTALVKSGAFTVAERQRIQEGVTKERQFQASGAATGRTANTKFAGAQYIFEAAITEGNPNEKQSEGNISVGGMEMGRAGVTDAIGLDVRIISAETGLVIDSVNVRKKIEAAQGGVSGIGKLAQSIAGLYNKSVPLNPDANVKISRKESVDKAVRSCIEAAVLELAKRLSED
jgi:curli biogenesis system outer membrane secretion channel CsgG